jgi:hypothetical protein
MLRVELEPQNGQFTLYLFDDADPTISDKAELGTMREVEQKLREWNDKHGKPEANLTS